MKNIIKNFIFAFALVGLFGFGATASAAPAIVGSPTASVSGTSATFNGVVNPNGVATTIWYQTDTGGPFQVQNLGAGTSNVTLGTYTLNNIPAGNHTLRIVLSYPGSIIYGNWVNFTIAGGSGSGTPAIIGTPTVSVSGTSATFGGVVNPNGTATTAWYQTDTGGPFQVQNLGAGSSDVNLAGYTLNNIPVGAHTMRVVLSYPGSIVYGNWVNFTIGGSSCSTPTISSLSSSSVNAGSGAMTTTVNGTNFVNGTTTASFNGSSRTMSAVTGTSFTLSLNSTDTGTAGSYTIVVSNGTGCSDSTTFTVNSVSGGGGGGGGGIYYYYASVVTQSATNISGNSATMNGTVNPNGYTTTAWFEYGTSPTLSSYSETTHNALTTTVYQNFSQPTPALLPNTTYYFRIAANNYTGTVRGTIYTFTTTSSITTGIVTTVQATNRSNTSATLNGIFVNQNGTAAEGYFEYGTTTALGSTTNFRSLGTSSSVSFADSVTGLSPNTIYYFRALVRSQGITYAGNVIVFQSTSTSTGSTPATPTIKTNVTGNEILTITTAADNIPVAGDIDYVITWKNNTKVNFENVLITVQLPKEVNFKDSNFGKEGDDNVITLNAGNMVPNQVGSMTITAKATSRGIDKVIVTTALMSYNEFGSTAAKEELAYVTNHVVPGNGLEGNALFGADFLPTTLLGWLALILIVLGLTVVGRKLYADYGAKKMVAARSTRDEHMDDFHLPH